MKQPEIRDSSVAKVLGYARDRIISGEFQPGTKLLPKILAEDCGTSLIPVREAFRALESEGLVTFIHNRGVWVSPLSLEDLNDLYSVRLLIESDTVKMAEPLTRVEIERLETYLEQACRAAEKGHDAKIITLNRSFHFLIYEKAKSPWRMNLIENLWSHTERYQRLSVHLRHDAADDEHRAIIDCLMIGDHNGASKAMTAHLKSTANLIAATYKK